MPPDLSQNHYEVLGLRPSASAEEIRRRYKFLAIAFHPDRFVRTPEHHSMAELRIKQVNEAYRVLADPQMRAQYDTLRLAAHSGHTPVIAAPWLAQMQRELEQAHTRLVQLEHESSGWRTRYEAAITEQVAVRQAHGEQERQQQQARLTLEAEKELLTRQLEQMARERVALDHAAQEQASAAMQKTVQLAAELASRERLVENLATSKEQWEKSNKSRQELLAQQVRKLQEDAARRDASLAQQKVTTIALQERLARSEQEARLAQTSFANTLRGKQQEIDRLLADGRQVVDAAGREGRWVRLWQIVAVIAILNTLLLLVLLLTR